MSPPPPAPSEPADGPPGSEPILPSEPGPVNPYLASYSGLKLSGNIISAVFRLPFDATLDPESGWVSFPLMTGG